MKMEHMALQVADPVALAQWYVKHLGFTVRRTSGGPAHAHFMLEKGGGVMLEIYRNPQVPVPNYQATHPMLLHLAFVSDRPESDRNRLLEAGAEIAEELSGNTAGDQFIMLRDPWGIPIQLVKRAEPMLKRAG